MSAIERQVEFQEKEDASRIPWTLLGPLSLLLAFALAIKVEVPLLLLGLSLAGLYLCASLHTRGFAYSLILLLLSGGFSHCFLASNHLWQLGFEGCMALAFLITSLSFEESALSAAALVSQRDARVAALENLEESQVKDREEAAMQQIALQGKTDQLRKELEEAQSDFSSISILNEVLRIESARYVGEREIAEQTMLDQKRSIARLQTDLEAFEKELKRLKDPEGLAAEYNALKKELNGARIEKEQTHLINETLARLHAKESRKAKDAVDQIQAIVEEKRKLEEQFSSLQSEVGVYTRRLEQMAEEKENARRALQQLADIQTERNFLSERLRSAGAELAHFQKVQVELEQLKNQDFPAVIEELQEKLISLENRGRVDPALVEKLQVTEEELSELRNVEYPALMNQIQTAEKEKAYFTEELKLAQQRIESLLQIEPLFKQLKQQFEEKNQTLHETRSALFHADTALQTLKMERDQKSIESNPVPENLQCEMEVLEEEISWLEEENLQLEEIVGLLSDPTASLKRKKKMKPQSHPDQELLF